MRSLKRSDLKSPLQRKMRGGADTEGAYQSDVPKGGPIALTVDLEVDKNRLKEFYAAIRYNASGSLAERKDGKTSCLEMDVMEKKVTINGKPQDADKSFFQFYEVWADKEAMDAHRLTDHFQKWNEFRFGKPDSNIPPGILSFKVESRTLLVWDA
jgi:quinol monooxygenase YgiN